MGNYAKTSNSGSSGAFPQQMQSKHSLMPQRPPSSPTRGQLSHSCTASFNYKAEKPQPKALNCLLPTQPEVATQNILSLPSTVPVKHPWCLLELPASLGGIHHLPCQHLPESHSAPVTACCSSNPSPEPSCEDPGLDKVFRNCFSWLSQCLIIFAVVCK